MIPRTCRVCRAVLSIAEQLRSAARLRPLVCRYETPTGSTRAVTTRWVCDHCAQHYAGEAPPTPREPAAPA